MTEGAKGHPRDPFASSDRLLQRVEIDKAKLYAILSKSIPQDMIDGIWQEIEEAGIVSAQPCGA